MSIDSIVEAEIKPKGPGAAVAVIRDGEVVHAKGYGLANVEWNIPIGTDTVFRLASITKQFTAAAILLLAERGKLNIDDPITKLLPKYPTSGHHITIHHLLTHTSGIFSYTNDPEFLKKMQQDMTPQDICDVFSKVPFDFKPGARFMYNNSGYILLGMIIEAVSGMPYADYVQQAIFEPLGMKQSCYLSTEPIIPKRASGYSYDEEKGFMNAPYLSMTQPYAAGALGSTLDDMILWDKALRENTLLPQARFEQMIQCAMLDDGKPADYGYGWGINTYRERPTVHHSGGIPGFATFIARFMQDSLTVIVLANVETFPITKVTAAIARQQLDLPEVKPGVYVMVGDRLKACLGKYMWEQFSNTSSIEVDDSGAIYMNSGRKFRILPASKNEFRDADDPEIVMRFSDERDGLFHTLTLEQPFRSAVTAMRVVE